MLLHMFYLLVRNRDSSDFLPFCQSLVLLQQADDLVEFESGGNGERRFSVLEQKAVSGLVRSDQISGTRHRVVHTYIILDVGSCVSVQQQGNQTMTFPLTDVMKSCVSFLHQKHKTHHQNMKRKRSATNKCSDFSPKIIFSLQITVWCSLMYFQELLKQGFLIFYSFMFSLRCFLIH